jgi:putative IMPACT (imprinted ancient) family translation regulator
VTQEMTSKRERSASPSSLPTVFKSTKIDEQTSSFIGAFSTSLSAKALQQLPEFRSASHRIAAWRNRSRQKSLMPESKILYESGHDDDGESWAGKRLQNVLNDTQAEGVVVVARWYGGQNIGPIRFTHIENCAKEAIWKWKVASTQVERDAASKKQKVDDEAQRRELVKNLQERDFNIFSLRKLLAEKKAELEEQEVALPTPQKPQPYEKMGTDALKRVAKARDATIAFILKQIDKTEEELRLVQALEDDTQESCKDVEEQQSTEEGKEPAAPTTPE